MAINNIPGVGPQNSDVASAVATSSAVQSMVGTQVSNNAPSAATIAAAVAAPSAATIAAAVNAPSASAIVAAGNSAGWASTGGLTWTPISTPSLGGVNTYTWSSLSGYKYYRLAFSSLRTVTDTSVYIRLNGDASGGNYTMTGFYFPNSAAAVNFFAGSTNQFNLTANYAANHFTGYFHIDQANTTGAKSGIFIFGSSRSDSITQHVEGYPTYIQTGAITSITLLTSGSNFSATGAVTLYGGN